MLKLFTKSTRNQNSEVDQFYSQFSEEQKAAIICNLFVMMAADGNLHGNEKNLLNSICDSFSMPLEDIAVTKLTRKGAEYASTILNDMELSQKEWYIMLLYSMIYADGHADEEEIDLLIHLAEQIGVSQEQCAKIIEKSISIMNQFIK